MKTTDQTRENVLTKIRGCKTRDECCQLASDWYGTREDCEGTPKECFVAGWVNAMDRIDEGTLGRDNDKGFVAIALHEIDNMYPAPRR